MKKIIKYIKNLFFKFIYGGAIYKEFFEIILTLRGKSFSYKFDYLAEQYHLDSNRNKLMTKALLKSEINQQKDIGILLSLISLGLTFINATLKDTFFSIILSGSVIILFSKVFLGSIMCKKFCNLFLYVIELYDNNNIIVTEVSKDKNKVIAIKYN